MNVSIFAAWVLALLLHVAPPAKVAAVPALPGWAETADERFDRYVDIAVDIATVVLDPDEAPVVSGRRGRAMSAALLVSIGYFESMFFKDVDLGPCYRDPWDNDARCDHGQSATIFQIKVGAGRTKEGWSREELFADRRKATRAALRALRQSFAACSRLGKDSALNAYASGNCQHGQDKGARRLRKARSLLESFPAPQIHVEQAPANDVVAMAVPAG